MPTNRSRNLLPGILLCACALAPLCCGDREQTAPTPRALAKRVLPVNADALDYMSWIGALDLVVGLPRTWREYGNAEPSLLERRGLPLLADFRAEAVMVLKPDLVLIDGTQSMETRRHLEQAGIELLVLERFRDKVADEFWR